MSVVMIIVVKLLFLNLAQRRIGYYRPSQRMRGIWNARRSGKAA